MFSYNNMNYLFMLRYVKSQLGCIMVDKPVKVSGTANDISTNSDNNSTNFKMDTDVSNPPTTVIKVTPYRNIAIFFNRFGDYKLDSRDPTTDSTTTTDPTTDSNKAQNSTFIYEGFTDEQRKEIIAKSHFGDAQRREEYLIKKMRRADSDATTSTVDNGGSNSRESQSNYDVDLSSVKSEQKLVDRYDNYIYRVGGNIVPPPDANTSIPSNNTDESPPQPLPDGRADGINEYYIQNCYSSTFARPQLFLCSIKHDHRYVDWYLSKNGRTSYLVELCNNMKLCYQDDNVEVYITGSGIRIYYYVAYSLGT